MTSYCGSELTTHDNHVNYKGDNRQRFCIKREYERGNSQQSTKPRATNYGVPTYEFCSRTVYSKRRKR